MKLTLTMDGKEKIFDSDGVNARASVEAFDVMDEYERIATEDIDRAHSKEMRDKMLDCVIRIFRNQFTHDQFWDGCNESFFAVVPPILKSAITGVHAKFTTFPNPEAPKAEV